MCGRQLMKLVYGEGAGEHVGCGHSAHPAAGPSGYAPHRPSPGHRGRRGLAGLLDTAVASMNALGERIASAGQQRSVAAAQGGVADLMSRLSGRVNDLTHAFGNDFPVIEPFVLPPHIEHFATIPEQGFNANKLTIDEHTGTHMDGPAHLDDTQMFTDQIPVDRLIAPLCVIRIRGRAAEDPDTTLSVDDVHRYERHHGRIPAGSFVVMDSGWAVRVPKPGAYLNRDAAGVPHFPGLSAEAVTLLVEERGVFAAGVDTSSLDAGVNIPNPQAHRNLLGAARYGVENITNLGSMPDRGGIVVVGALRHHGGYAGPVRLLGLC